MSEHHTKRRFRRLPIVRDVVAATWNRMRMPGRSHRGELPAGDDHLRAIAEELRRHIEQIADRIGERNIRHHLPELRQTADYIEAEFLAAGYSPRRQEYEIDSTPCHNLEVEILGTKRPDEIVIVGAHYDSVPGSPAANDNGSGVAALLSLARFYVPFPAERTIRFVAFVNEESPYAHTPQMGSWVYARRCKQRAEQVTAMLSLETIGYYSDLPESQQYPPVVGWLYPSRGNFIGFIGNTRHGELVHQVVRAFRRSEPFPSQGAALPETISDISRSDHWSFWQEGYPALMVTDTANFRYPYYHTPQDTIDKIDFEKTARVVRGLRAVIHSLASQAH